MMKYLLTVLLSCSLSAALACNEGLWRLESGLGEAAVQNMDLPPGADGGLSLVSTEGTFELRLVQASESDDSVTLVGSQQAYLYTLNYEIETGVMAIPMTLTMDGAQGGIQYTFWSDGAVDVGALPEAEGNWTVTAEVLGSAIPFSDEDVPILSRPGFEGSYECADGESLTLNLTTPDGDLAYQLAFTRAQ